MHSDQGQQANREHIVDPSRRLAIERSIRTLTAVLIPPISVNSPVRLSADNVMNDDHPGAEWIVPQVPDDTIVQRCRTCAVAEPPIRLLRAQFAALR
jgi:hypothetical protein